ncbi:phage holin family protein [Tropicibacter sp. Alg240-R139]|uniref:phage holin family protein n=1 Tax=Tropicibacter sp. Alg240-R139 TaxID=2305991 RepID=UPI0013DFBDC2|nr:phage holin family protein [Tropicibacter sp. Alg240-R139]
MNRISRNLTILFRTERLIARRQMAVLRTQTGLIAFAGLVMGIAIIMLNVSIFYALSAAMAAHYAALIVALGNALVALALVAIANRMSADKELEPATEVRDMALAEIESDLNEVADEARELTRNVSRMARDPLGTALPALIGPLLSLLLKSKDK